MTPCPDRDALAAALKGESSPFDIHIESCPICLSCLKEMAGSADLSSLSSPSESGMSRPLSDAMSRLRSESHTVFIHALVRTVPELPHSGEPGSLGRLGSIELRRILGQGGMGIVFEGYDTVLTRTVAVKLLPTHRLKDPAARDRFLREARAAASLTHDHVVGVYAIDETDGLPYLVMQFVDGESLADRLAREGRLTGSELFTLGIHAARGLAAAHARGLVHRDIKPGNLLIDRESFHVRVADFGLAKAAHADALTENGVIAGTPAYMAPEQAAGGAVDARSDLFALGAVLYHAATGVLPFDGESPFVILDQIRTRTPPGPRSIDPSIPAWFDDLVMRLLEKDPARRPLNANEVVAALEQSSALPGSHSRRGVFRGLLAAGLVGIAIVTAIALNGSPSTETAPTLRSEPELLRTGFEISGREEFAESLSEAVAEAPDGATIIVHGDGPFPTDTVVTNFKKLTIRAAPGSIPTFQPKVTPNPSPQFLIAQADLTLEGLVINWPVPSPLYNRNEDSSRRSAVAVTGGALVVRNCRFQIGDLGAALAPFGSSVTVSQSEFIGSKGLGLILRLGNAPVRIERSHFQVKNVLMLLPARSNPLRRSSISMEANEMIADVFVGVFVDNIPRTPTPIMVRRNVLDAGIILGMYGLRSVGQNFSTHAAMTAAAKQNITWTDEANLYRQGTHYLEGNRPNLFQTFPSKFTSLAEWKSFWNQSDTPSSEGTIRYREVSGRKQFDGIESGATPDPIGIGKGDIGPQKE